MADSSAEPTDASSGSVGSDENATQIQPIRMPTTEEIRAQDVWNNCGVRAVTSGVMGGGLGLMMGLFLGALDNPIMHDTMTARQQFVFTAKQMGQRSWNSCKTFAIMGLVFSAAECCIEQRRAKHDTINTAFAGCVTGGSMSARGGPKAACIGCAGFATFSVLIEKFFDRHT
ncbi:Mitochondrial import inner membrane translocase subunit TIM22-1 [Cardamine amara subsp. amara]|uniref:Mitochondrial import inner membrane translocase subunit TIM22-1 n=1 Tax=Cardamine amara subsp. amara TaxID=228776 RepID=A0ABD1ABK7_CARAN